MLEVYFGKLKQQLIYSLTSQFYAEDQYKLLPKQICMAGNGFLDIICACIFCQKINWSKLVNLATCTQYEGFF